MPRTDVGRPRSGRLLVAVALVSGAGLAAEITLMRILSIVEWNIFAWMVISLALLGFGASGTFLALARGVVERHHEPLTIIVASIIGPVVIGSLQVALSVEWRALELLWNPAQIVKLGWIYVALALPFFLTGVFIGINLMARKQELNRVYGFDLAGAALGAVFAAVLLLLVTPEEAWMIIAALPVAAAFLLCWTSWHRLLWPLAATALLLGSFATGLAPPIPGEYKALTQALRVPGAGVVARATTPLSDLRLLASPRAPLRIAPGLSLNHFDDLPLQRGVYVDGDDPVILNRTDAPLLHLDSSVVGVAIEQVGGESDTRVLVDGLVQLPSIVRLWQHGFSILVAEPDRELAALIRSQRGWGGEVLDSDRLTLLPLTLRSVLYNTSEQFDLILLSHSGAIGSIEPTEHLTRESFSRMHRRLQRSGLVAVTFPIETPPRTFPPLLASIAEALERDGRLPSEHVAILRGWDRGVILVAHSPLDEPDVQTIIEFAERHSFDVAAVPGPEKPEPNRFNQLDEPWYSVVADRILAGPERRAQLAEEYKFDAQAATDDRPWSGARMRWATITELIGLREEGGIALVGVGYPVLLATLIIAVVSSLALILVPLLFIRRDRGAQIPSGWRLVLCFGSLGLAFLLIEIVYIHRIEAILGRPLEAVIIVLGSFLLFAGLGSLAAKRLRRFSWIRTERRLLFIATFAVAVCVTASLPLLHELTTPIGALAYPARLLCSILLIAPVGFLMGIPFPTALARIRDGGEGWIAWAWGINGCASVVSAVLAVLLSIHFGLTAVTLFGAALYLIAGTSLG